MTGLASLELQPSYRSGRNSLFRDFYLPAVGSSVKYDRAVGYFSGALLSYMGQGLDEFASRGGVMRLVASPVLSPEDLLQIQLGYAARDLVSLAALRELRVTAEDPRLRPGLGRLGLLVASGRLEVKLAFVVNETVPGIYHEKVGILEDTDQASIVFKGSANETLHAMEHNFESIDVFRSWVPHEDGRVAQAKRDFNSLWRNETELLDVVPFTEVARETLEKLARESGTTPLPLVREARRSGVGPQKRADGVLRLPPHVVVRDYQKAAVRGWLSQGGRGILQMATGTGKTLTALAAAAQLAAQLASRDQPQLLTVVVVPYQHLVDQWMRDVRDFGIEGVAAYESQESWRPAANALLDSLQFGSTRHGVIVTTNRTFQLGVMSAIFRRLGRKIPILLVGDEVHNLGAAGLKEALPETARFRLGLSATPERWFDVVGTEAIRDYFGEVVYELGLGGAIEIGALVPYDYFPVVVQLDEWEADLYDEITDKIARAVAIKDLVEDPADETLALLLRQRANVLAHASAKLPSLRDQVLIRRNRHHQLIYCAEGRRPGEIGATSDPTQLELVLRLVGNELGMSAAVYVAGTHREERRELLRRFSDGRALQALLSMRCLDEGVDIPDARLAYLLASSTNPRQFIQRRGRVLRRAEGKSYAEIVDFVVVPPPGSRSARSPADRKLVARELARVVEFSHLARNEGHSLDVLRPVREAYSLMDV